MMNLFTLVLVWALPSTLCAVEGDWLKHELSLGADFSDADVSSDGSIVVVGGAFVLFSENKGQKWDLYPIEVNGESVSAATICFGMDDTLFAAAGSILKCRVVGEKWTWIADVKNLNGAPSYLTTMDIHPSGTGAAAGPNDTFMRTYDNGLTWHTFLGSCDECCKVEFLHDTSAIMVGLDDGSLGTFGVVARWPQEGGGGHNFIPITGFLKIAHNYPVYTFASAGEGHLVVGGAKVFGQEGANISISTNHGEDWLDAKTWPSKRVTAMVFVNEDIGYAGLESGDIYATFDGGLNWTLDYQGDRERPVNDLVTSEGAIIAVCSRSTILVKQVVASVPAETESPVVRQLTVRRGVPIDLQDHMQIKSPVIESSVYNQVGMVSQSGSKSYVIRTDQLLTGLYYIVVLTAESKEIVKILLI